MSFLEENITKHLSIKDMGLDITFGNNTEDSTSILGDFEVKVKRTETDRMDIILQKDRVEYTATLHLRRNGEDFFVASTEEMFKYNTGGFLNIRKPLPNGVGTVKLSLDSNYVVDIVGSQQGSNFHKDFLANRPPRIIQRNPEFGILYMRQGAGTDVAHLSISSVNNDNDIKIKFDKSGVTYSKEEIELILKRTISEEELGDFVAFYEELGYVFDANDIDPKMNAITKIINTYGGEMYKGTAFANRVVSNNFLIEDFVGAMEAKTTRELLNIS